MSEFLAEARILVRPDTTRFRAELESALAAATKKPVVVPVTFTATVSPSTATGTVEFFDGSASLGTVALSSGQASLTTSSLAAGKHSITAIYSGNANLASSTSAVLSQNVTGKK